jgi:hypothetical protein
VTFADLNENEGNKDIALQVYEDLREGYGIMHNLDLLFRVGGPGAQPQDIKTIFEKRELWPVPENHSNDVSTQLRLAHDQYTRSLIKSKHAHEWPGYSLLAATTSSGRARSLARGMNMKCHEKHYGDATANGVPRLIYPSQIDPTLKVYQETLSMEQDEFIDRTLTAEQREDLGAAGVDHAYNTPDAFNATMFFGQGRNVEVVNGREKEDSDWKWVSVPQITHKLGWWKMWKVSQDEDIGDFLAEDPFAWIVVNQYVLKNIQETGIEEW